MSASSLTNLCLSRPSEGSLSSNLLPHHPICSHPGLLFFSCSKSRTCCGPGLCWRPLYAPVSLSAQGRWSRPLYRLGNSSSAHRARPGTQSGHCRCYRDTRVLVCNPSGRCAQRSGLCLMYLEPATYPLSPCVQTCLLLQSLSQQGCLLHETFPDSQGEWCSYLDTPYPGISGLMLLPLPSPSRCPTPRAQGPAHRCLISFIQYILMFYFNLLTLSLFLTFIDFSLTFFYNIVCVF